ncbi:MAG: AcrR family transcriptional regulator [Planctomycetota bacterium]|jgi:AcrR family transcriptional regulator
MIIRKRQSLNRPGTATQQKGLARLLSILEAATDIFMEQGYNSLTMRKVATQAGISIGNLNYYYRTKEDLLRDLLDFVINPYLDAFDQAREQAGESPTRQMEAVLTFWIDDLATPETTVFFPECWALANHNPFVSTLLDDMYIKARQSLNDLIPQINPTLTEKESETIALYMCASMEGLTIFAGHEKSWSAQLDSLKKLSINNFMNIIKNTIGSKRIQTKTKS